MALAPLPDHSRTGDPLWQHLFHGYRHVITPLRCNGWTTDIELCGGEHHVRADLGDGSELIIAGEYSLPVDPSEVTGWTVVRRPIPDAGTHTPLYDSVPGHPQQHHGTSLVPLFMRLDELDACAAEERLSASMSSTSPEGATHNHRGPIEKPGTAYARYFDWSHCHLADGWQRVWERMAFGDPRAIFEKNGHVGTVRLTRFPTPHAGERRMQTEVRSGDR